MYLMKNKIMETRKYIKIFTSHEQRKEVQGDKTFFR